MKIRTSEPTSIPEEYKVAAVKLRLAGVDQRLVEHYLYCGDHSVMSILEWLETGHRTADYYNNEHLRWLQSAGKIES